MQHPEAGQRQLPAYKSHKTVWALKIADIQQSPADEMSTVDGGTWRLIPENPGYGPITVPHSYVVKHAPQPGGYYVVYADGYTSFSPAKAFEEGNTPIDNDEPVASVEQAIKSAGADRAPRVMPADIEAEIASEHYFTAADGARCVTDDMVSRFLSWKLPADFAPDCGISFKRESDYDHPEFGRTKFEPTGTNLLHAGQAKAMLEHILQPQPEQEALRLLTFCVLVLRNGFTITGQSACASPENFDADIGRRISRDDAIRQVWPLLGFRLRDVAVALSLRQPEERLP